MANKRTLPPLLGCPTNTAAVKMCAVMTGAAIQTIEVEGRHFACMVTDRPDLSLGAVSVMDRGEVEGIIALLHYAIDDADRLNAGLPSIHAVATGAHH